MAGTFLMGLSIVCLALTVLWIGPGLADMPEELSEKNRLQLALGLFLAGVFIILEVAMFLSGRYLRRTGPGLPAEEIAQRNPTRPAPLMVYLAVSLGIGLFTSYGGKIVPSSKALFLLIGQPQVFVQLLFGGILGFNLGGGVLRQALIVAANLLYFPAFFYPVYAIATMNRAVEVVRCRQMKILLAIFVGVHILMAMVMAMLLKA